MHELFEETNWKEFIIMLVVVCVLFKVGFWWGLLGLALSFLYSIIFLD